MRNARLTLIVVAAIAPALQAATPHDVVSFSCTHVRAAHPVHRSLLRHGYERSATLRRLTADIEASSWLVFVQTGRCPEKITTACLLHFVGVFEGKPYVRVIVRHEHRHPDDVITSLAHELQHAREVIQMVDTHDAEGIRSLFKRIGWVSVKSAGVETYETKQAVAVAEAVWRELMIGR
jgi:hypothetical protein